MTERQYQRKEKDNKGWLGLLGLLGLLGGVAWAAFGKKPGPGEPAPRLGVVSVVFNSGPFYPGSEHTVVLTLRNTGNDVAQLQAPTFLIAPDVGNIMLGPLIGYSYTIQPGALANYGSGFVIPLSALPGSDNDWALTVSYDGRQLLTGGPAFIVEAPPAPFLVLVPPVLFT